MDLAEIKEKKRFAEESIVKILQDFQAETGLIVEEVRVHLINYSYSGESRKLSEITGFTIETRL